MMTDEQCNVIVDAIKDLTLSVREVADSLSNISPYHDDDLRKEVHLIAEIIEDFKPIHIRF